MKLSLAMVLLLMGAALTAAGPIPPQSEPQRFELPPLGQKTMVALFKGGERSVVIVSGGGRSPLTLYVYDPHGNCVAHDDVVAPATADDLAVEWFPAATGRYTIELRNVGGAANKVQMAIR